MEIIMHTDFFKNINEIKGKPEVFHGLTEKKIIVATIELADSWNSAWK